MLFICGFVLIVWGRQEIIFGERDMLGVGRKRRRTEGKLSERYIFKPERTTAVKTGFVAC